MPEQTVGKISIAGRLYPMRSLLAKRTPIRSNKRTAGNSFGFETLRGIIGTVIHPHSPSLRNGQVAISLSDLQEQSGPIE
jgi:hypothetical protein